MTESLLRQVLSAHPSVMNTGLNIVLNDVPNINRKIDRLVWVTTAVAFGKNIRSNEQIKLLINWYNYVAANLSQIYTVLEKFNNFKHRECSTHEKCSNSLSKLFYKPISIAITGKTAEKYERVVETLSKIFGDILAAKILKITIDDFKGYLLTTLGYVVDSWTWYTFNPPWGQNVEKAKTLRKYTHHYEQLFKRDPNVRLSSTNPNHPFEPQQIFNRINNETSPSIKNKKKSSPGYNRTTDFTRWPIQMQLDYFRSPATGNADGYSKQALSSQKRGKLNTKSGFWS